MVKLSYCLIAQDNLVFRYFERAFLAAGRTSMTAVPEYGAAFSDANSLAGMMAGNVRHLSIFVITKKRPSIRKPAIRLVSSKGTNYKNSANLFISFFE